MRLIESSFHDSFKAKAIESICAKYGYQPLVDNLPNPVSQEDFALNVVETFVKQVIMAYEADKAVEVARKQAINKCNQDFDSVLLVTPT